jgi:hypothetical protein
LYQNKQFSLGGLAPSADILRLIEDIHAEDDAGMQNSFQVYDGCSGKSICSFWKSRKAQCFLCKLFEKQVILTNARLPPTFTNAAVTLLQQSLPKLSLAQRAMPPLLVFLIYYLLKLQFLGSL